MYACVSYFCLFKCIIKYRLYKQIKPLHGTGVPKLTPGYCTDRINTTKKTSLDLNVLYVPPNANGVQY